MQPKKCTRKQPPKKSQQNSLGYLNITKKKQVKQKQPHDNESNANLLKGK